MSESSPSDLAIAFRSFARRIRDALAPVDGDTTVAPDQLAELQVVIDQAAAICRSTANASAIAEAIEAKPAGAWRESALDELRTCALNGGKLLRAIERAAREAAAERTEPEADTESQPESESESESESDEG